ncbi:MAG TPA: DUF2007 domain-containing protein [Sphingomicrobium sp.]|nr:DUF2007 domain-containing protein [Sphingomicrobium sp.]
MALVELARFQTKVEADLARLLLEAEGFHVMLFDEGMNHIGLGSIMPIRLMVLDDEYEAAAALLAAEGLP